MYYVIQEQILSVVNYEEADLIVEYWGKVGSICVTYIINGGYQMSVSLILNLLNELKNNILYLPLVSIILF